MILDMQEPGVARCPVHPALTPITVLRATRVHK